MQLGRIPSHTIPLAFVPRTLRRLARSPSGQGCALPTCNRCRCASPHLCSLALRERRCFTVVWNTRRGSVHPAGRDCSLELFKMLICTSGGVRMQAAVGIGRPLFGLIALLWHGQATRTRSCRPAPCWVIVPGPSLCQLRFIRAAAIPVGLSLCTPILQAVTPTRQRISMPLYVRVDIPAFSLLDGRSILPL